MKTNSLEAALRDVENTIGLQWLTDAGHPCKAAFTNEIIVCFVDLRRSTSYQLTVDQDFQDSGEKFIEDYYRLGYKAVSKALWMRRTRDQPILNREDSCIPKRHKYLGDGMMLVWEPGDAIPHPLAFVLQVAGFIQGYFAQMTDPSKEDKYPAKAQELELGIGIASGKAWRLEFGPGLPQDYVGSTVNLAARLQAEADPKGVLVATTREQRLLKILTLQEKMETVVLKIRGFGSHEITGWKSSARYLGMPLVLPDDQTRPPSWRGLWLHELLPLVPDEFIRRNSNGGIDISVPSEEETGYADRMLELRRAVEVLTVRAAAKSEDSASRLKETVATMNELVKKRKLATAEKEQCIRAGEQFHTEITKLAGFEEDDTGKLLKILMKPTGPDYKDPSKHLSQIVKEHEVIIEAIESGDVDDAEKAMRIHLAAQPVRMRA